MKNRAKLAPLALLLACAATASAQETENEQPVVRPSEAMVRAAEEKGVSAELKEAYDIANREIKRGCNKMGAEKTAIEHFGYKVLIEAGEKMKKGIERQILRIDYLILSERIKKAIETDIAYFIDSRNPVTQERVDSVRDNLEKLERLMQLSRELYPQQPKSEELQPKSPTPSKENHGPQSRHYRPPTNYHFQKCAGAFHRLNFA